VAKPRITFTPINGVDLEDETGCSLKSINYSIESFSIMYPLESFGVLENTLLSGSVFQLFEDGTFGLPLRPLNSPFG
jgi:hypothetical protein